MGTSTQILQADVVWGDWRQAISQAGAMQSCCQGVKLINPVRVDQLGLNNVPKHQLPLDLACDESGFTSACRRLKGV